MPFNPKRPYQDLPALPPTSFSETPCVLKATIRASRALARLDGASKRLPDPTMLINLIPLMEAQASSEIENIVTTNDELFRAANGAIAEITASAKEALRYSTALRAGYELVKSRPVTTQTAIDVCTHIHDRPVVVRDQPGTYIGNPSTGERIYTPPEGQSLIRDHLSAWEKFIHGDHDLDPLVVMALAHYQFEAIHPFFDGNGRTGRILNLLILIDKDLLELPVLYLSGHVMRHKERYYDLLGAVTREDAWEPWVLFMLEGVESTSQWTSQLIDDTDTLRMAMEEAVRAEHPKLPAEPLVRLFFTRPYLRIDNIVDDDLAKRQTASRWLNDMADSGLIGREKIGRNLVFVNNRLLDMLLAMELPA